VINIQQLIAQMQQLPTGMAPPNQPPLQVPNAGNHMMPGLLGSYGRQAQGLTGGAPVGPYGAQAQQLAGLLGGQPQMQQPFNPGMFMPGFRPGIDTPITNGSARSQGNPRRRVQEY
jgi:hypothetical protein